MLMAAEPKRAQRFYRDGLGAKIQWADPNGSWTVMDLAGQEVCLHGNGSGRISDTGLAIEVDDLEQACAAIEQAGGHVLRPTSMKTDSGDEMEPDWLAIVTDTEGNRFCVVRKGGCFLHPSLFPEGASASTT